MQICKYKLQINSHIEIKIGRYQRFKLFANLLLSL